LHVQFLNLTKLRILNYAIHCSSQHIQLQQHPYYFIMKVNKKIQKFLKLESSIIIEAIAHLERCGVFQHNYSVLSTQ